MKCLKLKILCLVCVGMAGAVFIPSAQVYPTRCEISDGARRARDLPETRADSVIDVPGAEVSGGQQQRTFSNVNKIKRIQGTWEDQNLGNDQKKYIPATDPRVEKIVQEEGWRNLPRGERVLVIVDWVHDFIRYNPNGGFRTPIDVIEDPKHEGCCVQYSELLTTLLIAAGIPEDEIFSTAGKVPIYDLHRWNVLLYSPDGVKEKKWVFIDPMKAGSEQFDEAYENPPWQLWETYTWWTYLYNNRHVITGPSATGEFAEIFADVKRAIEAQNTRADVIDVENLYSTPQTETLGPVSDSTESQSGENKKPRILKDVERISHLTDIIVEKKIDIPRFVEEPLLEAIEILYDKNIETRASSANENDIERGYAFILISYTTLSNSNRNIIVDLEREGSAELTATGEEIILKVPVDETTSLDDICDRFVEISRRFLVQEPVWIQGYPEGVLDPQRNVRVYHAPDGLYYLSKEHYLKVKYWNERKEAYIVKKEPDPFCVDPFCVNRRDFP